MGVGGAGVFDWVNVKLGGGGGLRAHGHNTAIIKEVPVTLDPRVPVAGLGGEGQKVEERSVQLWPDAS